MHKSTVVDWCHEAIIRLQHSDIIPKCTIVRILSTDGDQQYLAGLWAYERWHRAYGRWGDVFSTLRSALSPHVLLRARLRASHEARSGQYALPHSTVSARLRLAGCLRKW